MEGVAALATGRSLLRLPGVSRRPADRASAVDPGIYGTHPDPLVGYALRAGADLQIYDGAIRSDGLGLRTRQGPAARPDALRIAVLGDSVAFGFGLDDDETLATRLEQVLRASLGPEARPVECRTVAMPGWNHRNAVHFLLDHLAALDPHIVVYMPVGNDLEDTDGVLENGRRRRRVPDPASADPWLFVGPTVDPRALDAEAAPFLEDGDLAALAGRIGPPALRADLSPESRRRYDENAGSIALLAERMERRGARVLIANFSEGLYVWHLWRRLIERGLELPVLPLYTELSPALRLPDDPHPNAEATFAMAVWVAEELLGLGWLPSAAGAPLPPVDEACSDRRAPRRTPAEVVELSEHHRRMAREALRPALDMRTGEGLQQLYSPLERDGASGTRLLAVLARAGDRLEVALAPAPGRPDLYPLDVSVQVDGRPVGTLVLGPDDLSRETYALPPAAPPSDVMEVRLVPERWVARTGPGGPWLVSFRPVRLASLP